MQVVAINKWRKLFKAWKGTAFRLSSSETHKRSVERFEKIDADVMLNWYPCITHQGHDSIGTNHQLKKLLIVKHILLVSTLGNM